CVFLRVVFVVFFFQAEDGIRDFHVTGVQTCALPIMGEPELGRDYLERMVPIRREVLGDNDAKTLESLHNLAVMRVMTGDKPGALAMQRQLVETQTRRLGAEHPKTLSERGNLASMLIDSGKAEQALPISTAVV